MAGYLFCLKDSEFTCVCVYPKFEWFIEHDSMTPRHYVPGLEVLATVELMARPYEILTAWCIATIDLDDPTLINESLEQIAGTFEDYVTRLFIKVQCNAHVLFGVRTVNGRM